MTQTTHYDGADEMERVSDRERHARADAVTAAAHALHTVGRPAALIAGWTAKDILVIATFIVDGPHETSK